MKVLETPGSLRRFRRTPWRFQQTFETPLNNLAPFVGEIVSALQPIQSATLTLDQVVFEPRHVMALLAEHYIHAWDYARDRSLEATGEAEIAKLLIAALRDMIDFAVLPTPKRFAIYADHDEFITFFAVTKSNLNRVVQALARKGFQTVDYQRQL